MDAVNELSPDDDLLDAIQLTLVSGVGPRLWQNLLAAFGSPHAILQQSLTDLQRVPGIGPKVATNIRMSARGDAEREWQRCRELGIEVVLRDHAGYSPELGRIPDPPALLYRRGDWQPVDALAVAIVGSRHSTAYGRRVAEQLAGGLSRAGFTIVSGLARGIDAAAHRGALASGGRTIAVCATGMNHVYPPEHADLADEIARQGALLTESPLDQAPLPGLFPQRNRIISGLSVGVILVEASRKSGALHTARHALEQNREVFAVPGQIDSEHSLGCLDLLRDGVTLIRGVDDVLSALGPLVQPVERAKNDVVHVPAELVLTDQERTILNLIGRDATAIDELVRNAGLETNRVLTTLTMLEMRRLLRRLPGNFVVRM
ncbi:MAG TPA: DNA-processing protein DprA [Planctomycetaceae bacterium]|nr:DNA-processing protein DprA [Planctomycetaceae bacterium]